MEKVLYHYTSTYHLPKIMECRFLKLTESNLRFDRSMYRPIVWMTTSEDVNGHGLIEHCAVDKTEIKITIRWQKHFQYWKSWSIKNKADPVIMQALEKGMNASSWYVSEKVVTFDEIIKIENTKTGEIYYKSHEENAA